MVSQGAPSPVVAIAFHLAVAICGILWSPLRSSTKASTGHTLAPVLQAVPSTGISQSINCYCYCNTTAACDARIAREPELLVPFISIGILGLSIFVKLSCCITRGKPVVGNQLKGKGVWGGVQ